MAEFSDNWVKQYADMMAAKRRLPDRPFQQLEERVAMDVSSANHFLPELLPPGVTFQFMSSEAEFTVCRVVNGDMDDKNMMVVRFKKEQGKIVIETKNPRTQSRSTLDVEVRPHPATQEPVLSIQNRSRTVSEISRIALGPLFFHGFTG